MARQRGSAVFGWGAVLLALGTAHLALVAGLPIWIVGTGALDDALFVRAGEHLAAGDWLGPFDNRTLARGPFHPMFIALASLAGVPIRVAQAVLYLAAGALLLGTVRPWPAPRWTRVAVFAAFSFQPMLYHTDLLRVTREGVYVPLTVLVLALCVALLDARDARLRARAALAATLGAALGAFWLTREEGPWIVPMLAVAAFALVASRGGRPEARQAIGYDVVVIVLAGAVAAACVQLVCWQNDRHYGAWTAVEFRDDSFARAYGALLRIDPERRVPFVPVTREALAQAAAAGPAASQIAAVLLSGAKDGYVRYGCAYHRLDRCDGEFRGGWWMFALRDAAALAGHYGSAADAARYWDQLAAEIDAACAAGTVACGPPRQGFAPPLAPADLTAIAANTLRASARLVRFSGFELAPEASTGSEGDVTGAAAFLHSRAFARGERPDGFGDPGDRRRAAILHVIAAIYPWLVPPLAIAALCAFGSALARGLRALERPWVAAVALLAVAAGSRAALVGVVATTSIPILDPYYLSPAYPLIVLFAGIGAAGAWQEWQLRRSRRR